MISVTQRSHDSSFQCWHGNHVEGVSGVRVEKESVATSSIMAFSYVHTRASLLHLYCRNIVWFMNRADTSYDVKQRLKVG